MDKSEWDKKYRQQAIEVLKQHGIAEGGKRLLRSGRFSDFDEIADELSRLGFPPDEISWLVAESSSKRAERKKLKKMRKATSNEPVFSNESASSTTPKPEDLLNKIVRCEDGNKNPITDKIGPYTLKVDIEALINKVKELVALNHALGYSGPKMTKWWRALYEWMVEIGIITIKKRNKYLDFARCVICYVDHAEDAGKVSENIAKVKDDELRPFIDSIHTALLHTMEDVTWADV